MITYLWGIIAIGNKARTLVSIRVFEVQSLWVCGLLFLEIDRLKEGLS